MNDLEKYFRQNNERLISKWSHYFEIYDRHFSRFRDKEINILEVGVFHGGSLRMWKNYFGAKARIYGIDINPLCKQLEEEKITIFIGSQSDRKFLQEVAAAIQSIDILIDDGGHYMSQQIITYEELFPHISDKGVYLCEDLHTSYQIKFGGGYRRKHTFIEYSKRFIDDINAYHSEQKALKVNYFTQTADSLHYYDSILVIEKRKKEKPFLEETGNFSYKTDFSADLSLGIKIKRKIIRFCNEILRFFRLPGFIWR